MAGAFVFSVASARTITPLISDFSLTAAATPEPLPLAPLDPPAVVPPDPPPVAPPAPQPQKKEPVPAPPGAKESTRPAAKPAPAESRTPEEASARAADPKDPSGALIIKPPVGTETPAKPR